MQSFFIEPPCRSSWTRTLPCSLLSLGDWLEKSNCTIKNVLLDNCIITCKKDCSSNWDCDYFNSDGFCVVR